MIESIVVDTLRVVPLYDVSLVKHQGQGNTLCSLGVQFHAGPNAMPRHCPPPSALAQTSSLPRNVHTAPNVR
jgi:hypothetical protein